MSDFSILLIEDESLDALLLERMLQLNNFNGKVNVLESVEDAVEYLSSLQADSIEFPRLIILDMFLNGDNGMDILSFLDTQRESMERTSLIVVSASRALMDEDEVLKRDYVKAIIDKPLIYEDILPYLS